MIQPKPSTTGSVLPLVAVFITLMLLMVAFVIDIGWIYLAKSDLKNAADFAALSGAPKLVDASISTKENRIATARSFAVEYAGMNRAGNKLLSLDSNEENADDGDVVIGFVSDPFQYPITFVPNTENFNAIKVVTQLSEKRNDPLAMFFGGITGSKEKNVSAESIAVVSNRVYEFNPPSDQGEDTEDPNPPDDDSGDDDDDETKTPEELGNFALFPYTVPVSAWDNPDNWTGGSLYSGTFDLFSYDVPESEEESDGDKKDKKDKKDDKDKETGNDSNKPVGGNIGWLDFHKAKGASGANQIKIDIVIGVTAKTLKDLGGVRINQTITYVDASTGEKTSCQKTVGDIVGQIRYMIIYDTKTDVNGSNTEYIVAKLVAIRIESQNDVSCPSSGSFTPYAVLNPNAPATNIYNMILGR